MPSTVISKVKIDDLMAQEAQNWKAYNAEAETYATENQSALDASALKIIELKAYGRALTDYLFPFAFGKKGSRYFIDKGYESYHKGSSDMVAGGVFTNVGSLDYWAAAIVDPKFMDLCRQRIRARDDVGGYNNGAAVLEAFNPEAGMPITEHKLGDVVQGFTARHFGLAHYPESATLEQIGAYHRLIKELRDKFENIMRDPQKAAAVGRVRQYFIDAYEAKTKEIGAEQAKADKIIKADPVYKRGSESQRLKELAYIKALGFDELKVENGDQDQAIYAVIDAAKYKSGSPAPSLEESRTGQGLGPEMKRIVEGFHLDKSRGTLSAQYDAKDLYTYGQTSRLYPEEADRFDGYPSQIPEQAKAYIRGFVAGARKLSAPGL